MTEIHYPDTLPIEPLSSPPNASITVPGSKSITNRALVLAALSSRSRPQTLLGCLDSEDTQVMIDSLRKLGYSVQQQRDQITVFRGEGPIVPATSADLFVANSGTTMRFLTALVALGKGRYRLDGIPRMRERPIADLLDTLGHCGISATSETQAWSACCAGGASCRSSSAARTCAFRCRERFAERLTGRTVSVWRGAPSTSSCISTATRCSPCTSA